jgi:hypothetical protein
MKLIHMKLIKLLVSLACCLLFSTPLWAAGIPPIDEATPNPSGLYALSTIAASGAVTELTDKELAKIDGKDCGTQVSCTLAYTVYDLITTKVTPGFIAKEPFDRIENILTQRPVPVRN